MKHKLKKILLLFLLSGTLFVSCELQEDTVHQHKHNSNLKLYEMKFEELMTNKQFVNSFSKLPKSKKSIANATLGRTVMEDEYGFTIANKPAKVIENNSAISYTFLITRDSINANSFENLIIQTDSLNITKAIIIKYNLISPITKTEDNSYSFTSNSEITPIVYNNTTINESSKIIIICYWITTTYCNYGGNEHVAGANCTASYTYSRSRYNCTAGDDGTMDDISSGGGGSSGSGGGGSTTGTGSNYDGSNTSIHGNGSNSVNTAPVAPEINEQIEQPCDGDPIKNPKICASSPTNKKGGTFGCTRNHPTKTCDGQIRKKKHGGVDIEGELFDRIYNMHSGVVVSVRNSMGILEYQANSLGNFIEIETTTSLGTTIRIKYCHMGNIQYNVGDNIPQGAFIGYVGRSGNAAALGVKTHLHIQSKANYGGTWIETDPINLFDTIFDSSTFEPIGSKSSCN